MARIFKKIRRPVHFRKYNWTIFCEGICFLGILSTDLYKSNICRCLSMRFYIIHCTKMFGKTQYAPCSKVKGPPPPNNTVHVFLFFFYPVKFKKANILHNYLIYLYSRIASMYFKQTLIYIITEDIKYIVIYKFWYISHPKFVYDNNCQIQILKFL